MKRFYIGKKTSQYYKGLLIKADLGLHEQIAERIRAEIPPGARILDLGAGEGALSARLADMGYLVTAADMDAENFRCTQAEFSCINFDSAEEIETFVQKHTDSFDAVLGVEVIEHVHDQWQYVRQLLRMARPGGLVLVTTPNITSWLSRMLFLLNGRFHQFADNDLSYGHISPVSPWELSLILSQNGAADIKLMPAGTLPPLYLTGLNKLSVLSVLMLPFRLVMRGMIDGWCIMATARKPL